MHQLPRFALVVLIWAASATAQVSPTGATVAFLSKFEYVSLQQGMRLAFDQRWVTEAHLKCVASQPLDLFAPIMSRFFEEAFSPLERAEADAFFSSELGAQYMRLVDSTEVRSGAIAFDFSAIAMTDELNAKARQFVESSAGDKLFLSTLFRKGETRAQVVALSRSVVAKCSAQR